MSDYELTLILTEAAAKDEKAAKALVEGKIKDTKVWGGKDLAYPIKGAKRGYYVWFSVELEPDQVAHQDKVLRQNENVLRHLLISQ
jgi:ribosomal protein S6